MRSGEHDVGVATINDHGFRGPWFRGPKDPGVVRIAAVGDSVTFGWAVADDETYPAQISRLLDQAGVPHEIVNFGIPGYNAANELALYEQLVRPHEPDIVVICVTPNDLEPTAPPPRYKGGALGRWFEGTGVYGALYHVLDLRLHALVNPPSSPEYRNRVGIWAQHSREIRLEPTCEYGLPLLEPWRADMDALLAAVTADGSEVLVVTIPCRPLFREARLSLGATDEPLQLPEEMMGWQREVGAACDRAGATHVDLLVPFLETKGVYGKVDRGHPSANGQKTIAVQVTKALVSEGWVDPGKAGSEE